MLIIPPKPDVQFDDLDQIPLQGQVVSLNCPNLLLQLQNILLVIWRRGKIPEQWRFAEGNWIPKEENFKRIFQFRIISPLSVEAKNFFSIVSNQLCTFLSNNSFIDTSVQKGTSQESQGVWSTEQKWCQKKNEEAYKSQVRVYSKTEENLLQQTEDLF